MTHCLNGFEIALNFSIPRWSCIMDIPPLDAGPRAISPTDVSQFIRLDQCERFLRLRLHERNVSSGFMREFGVMTQPITPLLTQAGAEFETEIESAVDA